MIAGGVFLGFAGWFISMMAGYVLKDREKGAAVLLMLVSIGLCVGSYLMVSQ